MRIVTTMQIHLRFTLAAGAFLAAASFANAQNVISTSTDIFTPSFRGQANTVYYGWSSNFDSDPSSETGEIFNSPNPPTPNLGASTTTYPLQQTNVTGTPVTSPDIISSTNNIYFGPGGGGTAYLKLTIDTTGVVASGFTTVIIQGVSLQNAQAPSFAVPSLSSINGVAPTFVYGLNQADPTNQELQWWAKYELTGNQAFYDIIITLTSGGPANPISINKLSVDTLWSSTGFASDTAQAVPEPSTYAMMALGAAILGYASHRRRRVA